MIDPAGRLHNPVSQAAVVSVSNRNKVPQSQSFAAELSDKLASPASSALPATGLPATLPAGQQTVTWRDSAVTTTPAPQPSGLSGLVITYPTTISGTAGSAGSPATAGTETSSDATMSFDQSYWANQPAAVQQLQDIQDPAQRTQVATQLAQEGYSIDVPIMVWGWDPQLTTQLRQADGYTWVPSAEQQPVEVAPGLTFAGTSYNPAQPPAGSITV
ncbi:MAG: hypothetical protein WAL45_02990 [Terracidiphilus sp.]